MNFQQIQDLDEAKIFTNNQNKQEIIQIMLQTLIKMKYTKCVQQLILESGYIDYQTKLKIVK